LTRLRAVLDLRLLVDSSSNYSRDRRKGRTNPAIHITEKLNKIKGTAAVVPTVGRPQLQVATEGIDPPKQVRGLERARLPLSLDLRVGDNQDTELGELLEDTGASPKICYAVSIYGLRAPDGGSNAQQREVLALWSRGWASLLAK